MSNNPVSSLNEQLEKTASPASSTQSESRRDEPSTQLKLASRGGELVTLASLENPALPPLSEAKRFVDSPADARQAPVSGAAPFTLVNPADNVDDLADMPKGASDQYREKYAAVMREFRNGKLQIIVKDHSMAVAIAAERATKVDAGLLKKQTWNEQQRPASGIEQRDIR